MTDNTIRGHAPMPGPLYWDYRCLVCSHPVAQHANVVARITHRIRLARRFR